jgi:hypothetical protein
MNQFTIVANSMRWKIDVCLEDQISYALLNEFPHVGRGQVLLHHVNFTIPFIF